MRTKSKTKKKKMTRTMIGTTMMRMTRTGTTTIRTSIEFVRHIRPTPARRALRNSLALLG